MMLLFGKEFRHTTQIIARHDMGLMFTYRLFLNILATRRAGKTKSSGRNKAEAERIKFRGIRGGGFKGLRRTNVGGIVSRSNDGEELAGNQRGISCIMIE